MARTFLVDASLPDESWHDAVSTTAYVINQLPTPLLQGLSHFQRLFSRVPDYGFLRTFGSQCFPNLTPYTKNKLQPRSIRCLFVGYALHYEAYKCFDPLSGRTYTSQHVLFHEHTFPYSAIIKAKTLSPSGLTSLPSLPSRSHPISTLLPPIAPVLAQPAPPFFSLSLLPSA